MDDTISGNDTNPKNDAKMRSYGSVSVEDGNVTKGGGVGEDAEDEVESKPLLVGKQIDTRSRRRALFTSIGVIFGAIILVSAVVVVGRQRAHSASGLSPSKFRSAIRPEALPLEGTNICDASNPKSCKEADCAHPGQIKAGVDCSACMCGYDNNPNNPPFWCDGNAGCVARLKEFQRTRYGKEFECESGLILDDGGWCVRKGMEFCDPSKLDTDPEQCTYKCANPQYVDRCKGCMCGYNSHSGAWCDGNKGTPGDVNSGCTEPLPDLAHPKYGMEWECKGDLATGLGTMAEKKCKLTEHLRGVGDCYCAHSYSF